ncbi:MAG: 4Fe-4S binding protein [Chloroflexi bacterium]|nr:4Fe-4S binding protein [Chloroflexota bacterium]
MAAANERCWISGKRADACIECGECEEKCPQHTKIRRRLAEADKALTRTVWFPAYSFANHPHKKASREDLSLRDAWLFSLCLDSSGGDALDIVAHAEREQKQ